MPSGWPEVARFDRSATVCPDCGADDTQNGERSIRTRSFVDVGNDGQLSLVIEAKCPCGFHRAERIGR